MHNYEHKKLVEEVSRLDEAPADGLAFSQWIEAHAHLDFLNRNAHADEFVIYASGPYTFIHTVAVSNDRLTPVDKQDLLRWSFNPWTPSASYASGAESDEVRVERGLDGTCSKTLDGAVQLIFGRTFEGWSRPGRNYFEAHQEYTHLCGIHWRPEMGAYCRFDHRGDIESVISVTTRESIRTGVALVSFKWNPLEEYLAASNASLVRMFDFTLWRQSDFSGWPNEEPTGIEQSDQLFYHQKLTPDHAGYARGVQIVRPRRPARAICSDIVNSWFGRTGNQYTEFIAFDWRNNRIAKISTDPNATANYFNGAGNTLPFELSPAFFRPEVLLKYKCDRDKYTVSEREVSCRAAWHLRGIDVNEAGQVHAYVCYLRDLPYEEQLHWLSFNESPKASISERAVTNDFEGKWTTFVDPLTAVLSIVQRWQNDRVAWWTLRDEKLLDRVGTPITTSRDEWAEAFMDLAKLVVEGFETKPIRARLDAVGAKYEKEEKTIALIEKLLNQGSSSGESPRLDGLRTVQMLRSKAKGHAAGSEADQLAQEAIAAHESFSNHFRHVCTQVADDLEKIQELLSQAEVSGPR